MKRILIILLVLFCEVSLHAQQNKTYSSYNGESSLSANGSITLLPGFFVPSGSQLSINLSSSICLPITASFSGNKNYVLSSTVRLAGLKRTSDLFGKTLCDLSQQIEYLDGLGRSIQTLGVRATSGMRDLVNFNEYDPMGRQSKIYLPYADGGQLFGSFKTNTVTQQSNYYGNPVAPTEADRVVRTPYPYGLSIYESSTMDRVREQGAPGSIWQPGNDHTVRTGYASNMLNGEQSVRLFKVVKGPSGQEYQTSLASTSNYDTGELYMSVVMDENWSASQALVKAGTAEEFTDKDGNVVLRRKYNAITVSGQTALEVLSTYYVYDNYGNLCFVLPPGASADTGVPNATALNTICYQYRYDHRNRMIEKKLPGKGWEFMVYNNADQVMFSQNAVQRSKTPQQWVFSQYDQNGRIAMTGLCKQLQSIGEANVDNPSVASRTNLQADVQLQGVLWVSRISGNSPTGYSSPIMPSSMDIESYLNISYFDDYSFPGATAYPYSGASMMTKGLLTGSRIKVLNGTLGTTDMLLSINYYDEKAKLLKNYAQHYIGGTVSTDKYDETQYTWSFTGEMLSNIIRHNVGNTLTTIATRYEYDHMGRNTKTWKKTYTGQSTAQEILQSEKEFNELGQLVEKRLHNSLQKQLYNYNERSWLTGINDPGSLGTDMVFGMKINYANRAGTYNGNIGSVSWRTLIPQVAAVQQLQEFTYDYDQLNRLTKAAYDAPSATGRFNEEISYDVMGNIIGLKRTNGSSNFYNDMTYNYLSGGQSGNKLYGVSDVGTAALGSTYTYDENGNQKTNSRLGITDITYNHLDLPGTLSRASTSEVLEYTYDAEGNKLRKKLGSNIVDYDKGIQYNNASIDFILTEEGRSVVGNGTYLYEYFLKDHLGNTRATVAQNGNVIQVQDYFAFGMEMNPGNALLPSRNNNYTYNGKEKQLEFGLNQLDYGARFYDPILGRWNVMDPSIEKDHHEWSPYTYVYNNPVLLVDPDGRDSLQRAKALAIAKQFVAMNPGNTYVYGDKGGPGSKTDCSGLVSWAVSGAGEENPNYGGKNGAANISDNTTTIEERDVVPGNLVLLDNGNGPNTHIGVILSVDRDKNGNIVNMSMVDSGGKVGPRVSNLIINGTKMYWGKHIVSFKKWDKIPDKKKPTKRIANAKKKAKSSDKSFREIRDEVVKSAWDAIVEYFYRELI